MPIIPSTNKKNALLAYKEKLLKDIKYYDKRIYEDSRCNTTESFNFEDSSDSDDDCVFTIDNSPMVSHLKHQQTTLKTGLHATRELASLIVLQSKVDVMVEDPVIQDELPVTQPGLWREVNVECRIDLVPFSTTFYVHQANGTFGSKSYRCLKVVPEKRAQETELSKSYLSRVTTPSDAVEILRSYSVAYRSRRTTLAKLADKYANNLHMEPMREGGYILKCANLLEISWVLENKWSPVAPFYHKMVFDLENMDENYIRIIRYAHKQLSDPSTDTNQRTIILSKIIATCLEAQGTLELSESIESDTESVQKLEKRRLTLENEAPEAKKVRSSNRNGTNEEGDAGEVTNAQDNPKDKENNDDQIMAPPKFPPKKGKPKGKENTDQNRKSVKRGTLENEGSVAKKAKNSVNEVNIGIPTENTDQNRKSVKRGTIENEGIVAKKSKSNVNEINNARETENTEQNRKSVKKATVESVDIVTKKAKNNADAKQSEVEQNTVVNVKIDSDIQKKQKNKNNNKNKKSNKPTEDEQTKPKQNEGEKESDIETTKSKQKTAKSQKDNGGKTKEKEPIKMANKTDSIKTNNQESNTDKNKKLNKPTEDEQKKPKKSQNEKEIVIEATISKQKTIQTQKDNGDKTKEKEPIKKTNKTTNNQESNTVQNNESDNKKGNQMEIKENMNKKDKPKKNKDPESETVASKDSEAITVDLKAKKSQTNKLPNENISNKHRATASLDINQKSHQNKPKAGKEALVANTAEDKITTENMVAPRTKSLQNDETPIISSKYYDIDKALSQDIDSSGNTQNGTSKNTNINEKSTNKDAKIKANSANSAKNAKKTINKEMHKKPVTNMKSKNIEPKTDKISQKNNENNAQTQNTQKLSKNIEPKTNQQGSNKNEIHKMNPQKSNSTKQSTVDKVMEKHRHATTKNKENVEKNTKNEKPVKNKENVGQNKMNTQKLESQETITERVAKLSNGASKTKEFTVNIETTAKNKTDPKTAKVTKNKGESNTAKNNGNSNRANVAENRGDTNTANIAKNNGDTNKAKIAKNKENTNTANTAENNGDTNKTKKAISKNPQIDNKKPKLLLKNLSHKNPATKKLVKDFAVPDKIKSVKSGKFDKVSKGGKDNDSGSKITKIPTKLSIHESLKKMNPLRMSPRRLPSTFKSSSESNMKKKNYFTSIPRLMKKT